MVEPGPSPRVEILADEDAVGRRVADLIAEAVCVEPVWAEPRAVIGRARR